MKVKTILSVIAVALTLMFVCESSLEAKTATGTSSITLTLPEIANIVITGGTVSETANETDLLAAYNGSGIFQLAATVTVRLVTNSAWQLAVKVTGITQPSGGGKTEANFYAGHDRSAYYHTGFNAGLNALAATDKIIASSTSVRLAAGYDFTVNHGMAVAATDPLGDYVFSLTYTLTSPA